MLTSYPTDADTDKVGMSPLEMKRYSRRRESGNPLFRIKFIAKHLPEYQTITIHPREAISALFGVLCIVLALTLHPGFMSESQVLDGPGNAEEIAPNRRRMPDLPDLEENYQVIVSNHEDMRRPFPTNWYFVGLSATEDQSKLEGFGLIFQSNKLRRKGLRMFVPGILDINALKPNHAYPCIEIPEELEDGFKLSQARLTKQPLYFSAKTLPQPTPGTPIAVSGPPINRSPGASTPSELPPGTPIRHSPDTPASSTAPRGTSQAIEESTRIPPSDPHAPLPGDNIRVTETRPQTSGGTWNFVTEIQKA